MNEIFRKQYFDYQLKSNILKKLIKKYYIKNITKNLIGKTIDFGCGIGKLLENLPEGSIGFEINPYAVNYCKQKSLKVYSYDPAQDNYSFNRIEPDEFKSFVASHVLEHIEDTSEVIKKIFNACSRLKIEKILFVVPGAKGYQSDKTHVTFIDERFISINGLKNYLGYELKKIYRYPFNSEFIGRYFTHNELLLIYEKI